MASQKKFFAKYLARFQMGYQGYSFSYQAASIVMIYSLMQSFGCFIHISEASSGIATFHEFFGPTSFLLFFDFNYRSDPTTFTLLIQVLFLMAFVAVLASILAVRFPKNLEKQFRREDYLPGNAFTHIFSVIFVPCLLQPLIELTLSLYFCSGIDPDIKGLPIARTVFTVCNHASQSLLNTTRTLGAINLVCSVVFVAYFVLLITPRNEVPENAMFSQSRSFDFVVVTQKMVAGLLFLLRLYPTDALRIIAVFLLAMLALLQIRLTLTQVTFSSIQSIKMVHFCSVFTLITQVFQLVYVVWIALSPGVQILHPFQCFAFFAVAVVLAQKLADRLLTWSVLAILQSDELTANEMASFYLMYLIARENAVLGAIIPDGKGTVEAEQLNIQLFEHFMNCIRLDCVCLSLKSGEEVWDFHTNSPLKMRPNSNTDDMIRLVCTPSFVRVLVKDRFDRQIQTGRCTIPFKLFHLKFTIFEECNHMLASRLLQQLKESPKSFFQSFDFQQLQRVYRSDRILRGNHRFSHKEYLNVEKFVQTALILESLETALLELFGLLLRFYSNLANDSLDFSRRVGLIAELLETISVKVKELDRSFERLLPNQQAHFLAVIFYQSISLNKTRESEIMIAVKTTTNALVKRTE
jgi:hypothetical protein